jgi:hypothetical protein
VERGTNLLGINMSNLKVLPLQHYQRLPIKKLEGMYELEIEPLFNRDGYYCIRDISWFEYNKRAYVLKVGEHIHYKYILDMLSHNPLNNRTVKILEDLSKEKLLSKSQKELLKMDREWKMQHHNLLLSRKNILKIKKRRVLNGSLQDCATEVEEKNRN